MATTKDKVQRIREEMEEVTKYNLRTILMRYFPRGSDERKATITALRRIEPGFQDFRNETFPTLYVKDYESTINAVNEHIIKCLAFYWTKAAVQGNATDALFQQTLKTLYEELQTIELNMIEASTHIPLSEELEAVRNGGGQVDTKGKGKASAA